MTSRNLRMSQRPSAIGKTEIINSFNHYHGRRISNGPIESVNARIKSINRNGNGYQNFERFRVRVLYFLNENSGLKVLTTDLYGTSN